MLYYERHPCIGLISSKEEAGMFYTHTDIDGSRVEYGVNNSSYMITDNYFETFLIKMMLKSNIIPFEDSLYNTVVQGALNIAKTTLRSYGNTLLINSENLFPIRKSPFHIQSTELVYNWVQEGYYSNVYGQPFVVIYSNDIVPKGTMILTYHRTFDDTIAQYCADDHTLYLNPVFEKYSRVIQL